MQLLRRKCFHWLPLALLLSLLTLGVQAQDNVSKTTSVTGCLKRGVESGGFYIVGADGRFWELSGKIDATQVGRKVTVNGHVPHRPEIEEAKYVENEKMEANGKPISDFEVTGLKMISKSCQ